MEIDLLIHRDQVLYPIEIKKTAQPSRDAARPFKALESLAPAGYQRGPGGLVCLVGTRMPLDRDVEILPAGLL